MYNALRIGQDDTDHLRIRIKWILIALFRVELLATVCNLFKKILVLFTVHACEEPVLYCDGQIYFIFRIISLRSRCSRIMGVY